MGAFVDLRSGVQTQQTMPVVSEEDARKSLGLLTGDEHSDLLFWRDDTRCWVVVGGGPLAFHIVFADEKGLSHVPAPSSPGPRRVDPTDKVSSSEEDEFPADFVLSREEAELVVAEFARSGERTALLDWWEID